MAHQISSISFDHYKALRQFRISLGSVNVLSGANNAGKSTIIGALRALSVAIRSARSRSPESLRVGDSRVLGYRVSERLLPISLENVSTDYETRTATVAFDLSSGGRLVLHFSAEGGCVLVPESSGRVVRTPADFRSEFPVDIVAVPVLGGVENRERLLEEATVDGALATSRASRHFRNYWYRRRVEFDQFARLVASTWPGMVPKPPELDASSGELMMFVAEERVDRELYWVGYGFQVWCQLLSHVMRARPGSTLVVDEPEIYLHPDVQRKLLHVFKGTGANIVLATHSADILAEADPTEVVIVDKRKKDASRISEMVGVSRTTAALGAQRTPVLASLARTRRVLFLDREQDFILMRRLASRLDLHDLASGSGLTAMASGGLSQWRNVALATEAWGEDRDRSMLTAAVFEPDLRSRQECERITRGLGPSLALVHIFQRRSLANYLLLPAVLDRAISHAARRDAEKLPNAETVLDEVTGRMHDEVRTTFLSRLRRFGNLPAADSQVADGETFERCWHSLTDRLSIVPGDATLRQFCDLLKARYRIVLSELQIVECIEADDLAPELRQLLVRLDEICRRDLPVFSGEALVQTLGATPLALEFEARALQTSISSHLPQDDGQDWSDIAVELPPSKKQRSGLTAFDKIARPPLRLDLAELTRQKRTGSPSPVEEKPQGQSTLEADCALSIVGALQLLSDPTLQSDYARKHVDRQYAEQFALVWFESCKEARRTYTYPNSADHALQLVSTSLRRALRKQQAYRLPIDALITNMYWKDVRSNAKFALEAVQGTAPSSSGQ